MELKFCWYIAQRAQILSENVKYFWGPVGLYHACTSKDPGDIRMWKSEEEEKIEKTGRKDTNITGFTLPWKPNNNNSYFLKALPYPKPSYLQYYETENTLFWNNSLNLDICQVLMLCSHIPSRVKTSIQYQSLVQCPFGIRWQEDDR